MTCKAIFCCLLLLGAVAPALGQETQTLADLQCTYTLPELGWEFVDPKLAQNKGADVVILAKNQRGLVFTLMCTPLARGEKPTPRSFESFESGFLKSGKLKKLSGKRITFKSQPSYQIDAQLPGDMGCSVRLIYANHKLYVLQVINAAGALDAKEAESVFQGFNFTNQPEPMMQEESSLSQRGQIVGAACATVVGFGVLVLVIYLLVRNKGERVNPDYRDPGHEPGGS
jgi:hypothetical protein